jgi:beta-glucanase (GH16 family)
MRIVTTMIVALAAAVLSVLGTVSIGQGSVTAAPTPRMAPPKGYSARELVLDDRFQGGAFDYDHWNTFMGGQGNPTWNADGLPLGDSAAGTYFHKTYFSAAQVIVGNGLTLSMTPDTRYSKLGYTYRSGVVTTDGKFTLRSGYVQIKVKMPNVSYGSWPAIWFINPKGGGGSQEIDLQEGGFTAKSAKLPGRTPENKIFASTYHTPSGSQSNFSYVTPKPMNAGFNVYGMQYIPGRSIKTYYNGRLIGSWTKNISTTPYEIIIWNTQASANAAGFHTTGKSPNPSNMVVAEVQVYALPKK